MLFWKNKTSVFFVSEIIIFSRQMFLSVLLKYLTETVEGFIGKGRLYRDFETSRKNTSKLPTFCMHLRVSVLNTSLSSFFQL